MPLDGRQKEDRYSIAYFLRAEDKVVFNDPNGNMINAEDYHNKKFSVFRQSHEQQAAEPYLTGGMER